MRDHDFTMWPAALRLVAFAALVSALTACQTAQPPAADWPESPGWQERLQPGDMLSIKFPYAPELNEEQAIRPDGKISLQLAGDVAAAGKTPDELRSQLLSVYSSTLKNPELTVIVRGFASHRVYVGGEVAQPKMVMIEGGRLTAMDAIMQAGGFLKRSAKMSTVVILRHANGKRYMRTIDLKAALKDPTSDPFYLQPYDIVFVPRTAIDKIDQWVDQYINDIVPDNVVLTFDKSLDDDEDYQNNPFSLSLPSGNLNITPGL
jgi:protein involved in polysaccharide export with SLBB domain